MKCFNFFLAVILSFSTLQVIAQESEEYQYIYPKPNSEMVSNETNIILRHSSKLQEASINEGLISVVGSVSGNHSGDFLLTDDEQTIVFNPHKSFVYNEVVTVSVQQGIKTINDFVVDEYSFSFETEKVEVIETYSYWNDEDIIMQLPDQGMREINVNLDTLPAPPITIDSLNNPGPGYIFMATWDRNVPHLYGNFIFILDSVGHIVDSVRVNGAPYDFRIQTNGLLSYALGDFASNVPNYQEEQLRHIVLDSNLAVVDSFKMKNGYNTDFHEFLMLPNGHVMMMSYHSIIYDMSQIVPGGQTNCELVINIIQEQDIDKNVVFEWRNIDHIPITDSDEDLTANRINYSTLNAFEIDYDGNILASFRNHSEIMKISRSNGEIIWRMGSPRGEFTFIGEHEENAPYYYARQHDIRRLPNGNISLFDNGQFHQPPYSRGVEYSLDEVNKVATLVSEFRYPNGNIFCATAGNAQKLPNGGWFIGYGVPNPQFVKRNAVEYHPDGSIALELSLPPNVLAYRAYKFPWKELVQKPAVTIFEVLEGNTYTFNEGTNITGVTIKYLQLTGALYNSVTVTRLPYAPVQAEFELFVPKVYPVSILYEGAGITSHTSEIRIDLDVYPEIINPGKTSLFTRETPNQGAFTLLPTAYDSLSNELVATSTSFGEIVFGETDHVYTPNPPLPYAPLNYQKLLPLDSLALRWTGQGYYDLFQLQIFSDSLTSDNLIDTTMNSSFFMLKNLINHTIYFWRVRSILGSEVSTWSNIWSFEVTDAFITMNTPNGGETWSIGSEVVIRWETNILDSVRLDLLYGQQIDRVIDTSFGNPAYAWLIPTDLTVDTSYKIIITSLADPSIIDTSDASFTITPPSNVEPVGPEIPNDFSLFQNYPNPFNPSTTIRYAVPVQSQVKIKIYNSIGENIAELVNLTQGAGSYQVNWDAEYVASGIYFYSIQAVPTDGSEVFQSVKKMILLK